MVSNISYPESLTNCSICPRNCNADRQDNHVGFCGTGAGFSISSIFNHRGEEPVINGKKGICNIFFTGCNLYCIYCQNHQISRPSSPQTLMPLDEILEEIRGILAMGIEAVGFVSTAHVVPQVLAIIDALHKNGMYPIIVYNTNGYEKPETIRQLDGLVDVYLPDFKYISPIIAQEFSGVADYPKYAALALKEMYRQKGSSLHTNENGQAECGILVRHLVLPGHADESIKVLEYIASEISTGLHISLMSQYYPCDRALVHKTIGRELLRGEYMKVVNAMYKLGFRNGWVQGMESYKTYRPNFDEFEPF
jgi:putative pyruvate formate lyase activating enzyme